jgi:hypothetical protein
MSDQKEEKNQKLERTQIRSAVLKWIKSWPQLIQTQYLPHVVTNKEEEEEVKEDMKIFKKLVNSLYHDIAQNWNDKHRRKFFSTIGSRIKNRSDMIYIPYIESSLDVFTTWTDWLEQYGNAIKQYKICIYVDANTFTELEYGLKGLVLIVDPYLGGSADDIHSSPSCSEKEEEEHEEQEENVTIS